MRIENALGKNQKKCILKMHLEKCEKTFENPVGKVEL